MYTDKDDLLNKAKDLLKNEMSSISYITWIKSLEIESVNDNKIVLVALSNMQKEPSHRESSDTQHKYSLYTPRFFSNS